MEEANVKLDSKTFSYLITNCDSEEVMIKYHEEMKRSGVPVTKNVYISLINAYASCGQLEKAKQVLKDEGIPAKSLSEIKIVLAQALGSCGQFSDAHNMYKEIKQAGYSLEPKAAISLIVFSLIGDLEPSHLQTGLDLLGIVKNEFGITPPRKSLDFLLHACVNAKSLKNAQIVWKEYQAAGLPHNILNFSGMYQALLTAGDHKAAKTLPKFLKMIHMFVMLSMLVKQLTSTLPLKIRRKRRKNSKNGDKHAHHSRILLSSNLQRLPLKIRERR